MKPSSAAASADAWEWPSTRRRRLIDDDLRQTVVANRLRAHSACADRALLPVGFAGALRRGEFAALEVADLRFELEGVVIRLRRQKGTQQGEEVLFARSTLIETRTCQNN